MNLLAQFHSRLIYNRRVKVLSIAVADLIPDGASVLDIGCGDGRISSLILDKRPDFTIVGADVRVRLEASIPTFKFDGSILPHRNGQFDASLLLDVLHHTQEPTHLIREAIRITQSCVIIKDHIADGFLASPTLRFMDVVGNKLGSLNSPSNYWPRKRWQEEFSNQGLKVTAWRDRLQLYPWWISWLFGRSLHFLARLKPLDSSEYNQG